MDLRGRDTGPTSPAQRDVFRLRERTPGLSSHHRLVAWQRTALTFAVIALLAATVKFPRWTGVGIVTLLALAHLSTLGFRISLYRRSLAAPSLLSRGAGAPLLPDDQLPRYTVLVPAYREPTMIPVVLQAIARMDYPRHLLEVKLILEAEDRESLAVVETLELPDEVDVVVVPPVPPRTKPKALNYALYESTGELVTIYDAEDVPDPMQLRRAASLMARSPDTVACLQARLDSFNADQNIISQWFTLEYTLWFEQFLPGLVLGGDPVPLGGTSNHFRREALLRVGAWDPYNVTEDADLGIRLHRLGYRVGMLDSTTLEEANSDFVNWAKQRSRWHKGYLQTWLVHLRHPADTFRAMGLRGFMSFNLFVGGTPLLALLNPIFMAVSLLWFAARPAFVPALFPGPVLYLGLASWLVGGFLFFYSFLLTAAQRDDVNLFRAAMFSPVYFLMMSVGAYKAALQLLIEPSFWEKTEHGLTSDPAMGFGLEHVGTDAR